MKKILNISTILLVLALVSAPAHAWNQKARYISALSFDVNGKIKFTLFENGKSGAEQMCRTDDPWFDVQGCTSPNATSCVDYADRIANMLMNAKLAGKAVHVHQVTCTVFEVALKP